MPQAKCTKCRVRYLWDNKRHLVREAVCPKDGSKLQPTSQNVQLPVVRIEEPVYPSKYPPLFVAHGLSTKKGERLLIKIEKDFRSLATAARSNAKYARQRGNVSIHDKWKAIARCWEDAADRIENDFQLLPF